MLEMNLLEWLRMVTLTYKLVLIYTINSYKQHNIMYMYVKNIIIMTVVK